MTNFNCEGEVDTMVIDVLLLPVTICSEYC